MARYDLYRTRDGELVIDCQADTLLDLPTRFVVPLVPADLIAVHYPRLNPVFEVDDERYMMATQMAAAVPVTLLGPRTGDLTAQQFLVSDAIDMLLSGY